MSRTGQYSEYGHKRGDSFEIAAHISAFDDDGQQIDLSLYEMKSKLRDPKGVLITELTCELIDGPNGIVRLYTSSSTQNWPLTTATFDIRLTSPSGNVATSESFYFEIEESPSHD